MANLVVALGNNPWPHTLGLARVLVAPDQKLCSFTKAMNSAKEHFGREKGLEAAHYYLTPVYTEAPYLLSDVGAPVRRWNCYGDRGGSVWSESRG